MYPEYFEEFHYVVQDWEPVEREIPPLEERLKDQNHWQSSDWCCYNRGKHHGDFGIPQQCQNPFYLLGYAKGYEKYQQH
jgi:hypothetical protein